MPTLEDLEKLKQQVNELGNEPGILASRGETLEDIAPPENSPDAEIEQLLDDSEIDGAGFDEMTALLDSYASDDDLFPDGITEENTENDFPDIPDIDNIDTDIEETGAIETPDTSGTPDIPENPQTEAETGFEPELSFESEMDFEPELTDESVSVPEIESEPELAADTEIVSEPETGDITTEIQEEEPEDNFDFGDFSLDDITPEEESEDDSDPGDFSLDGITEEEPDDNFPDIDIEETGAIEVPDTPDTPEEQDAEELSLEAEDEIEDELEVEPVEELSVAEEGGEAIPDIEERLEDLGEIDSESDDDSISLDEELNFDEELGGDILSDINDIGDESMQFSLDVFGDQYNFKEDEPDYTENLRQDLENEAQSLQEEEKEEESIFSIDEEDFLAIKETLASYPRNLKIALEEFLSDSRRKPEDIKKITDALLAGESAKSLAAKYKKITKRTIKLPKNYKKQSGSILEARRASLSYRLIKEGWPVLRTVLSVFAALWIVSAMVFMWVYRPLKAAALYESGLEAISADETGLAEKYFFDAWDGWPLFYKSADNMQNATGTAPIIVKGWKSPARWLDYARAFRRRKQWEMAVKFYEGFISIKPSDKNARLEYVYFLSSVLGRYQKAEKILNESSELKTNKYDRDYTLALGDVYLDWAEDDPSKYENARFSYAKVLEYSRNDERALFSMMNYFLKIKEYDEVDRLIPLFMNDNSAEMKNPRLASVVFSGIGMYLLNENKTEKAKHFIDLAYSSDMSLPQASFANALYWKRQGDSQREFIAYKQTLMNLEGLEALSRDDLKIRIFTLAGMGRIQAENTESEDGAALARQNYSRAIELYKDARSRNQLGVSPEFGSIYLELADIFYKGSGVSGDLTFRLMNRTSDINEISENRLLEMNNALSLYNEASDFYNDSPGKNSYPVKELFRRGYLKYMLDQGSALVDFFRVVRLYPENYDARIALGTVLLESGDYEAASVQYSRALDLLDNALASSGGVLMPGEKAGHNSLLLRYIYVWNNLGVCRAKSGEYDYALGAFTSSSLYYDDVRGNALAAMGVKPVRDAEDRRILDPERSRYEETFRFPYLNRKILLGMSPGNFYVYNDIPSDIEIPE